jgi:hypothetical protein
MASEDVGPAAPGIVAEIHALSLFLTHAVLMLCRALKSRAVDDALLDHWMRHEHVHLGLPDFSLDKHNERGRRLGWGWRHFYLLARCWPTRAVCRANTNTSNWQRMQLAARRRRCSWPRRCLSQ